MYLWVVGNLFMLGPRSCYVGEILRYLIFSSYFGVKCFFFSQIFGSSKKLYEETCIKVEMKEKDCSWKVAICVFFGFLSFVFCLDLLEVKYLIFKYVFFKSLVGILFLFFGIVCQIINFLCIICGIVRGKNVVVNFGKNKGL